MTSILLVPAVEDPHRLLSSGTYGARPSKATRFLCRRHGAQPWSIAEWDEGNHRCVVCGDECQRTSLGTREWALILAWNGESVPEGTDRVVRRMLGEWWGAHADSGDLSFAMRAAKREVWCRVLLQHGRLTREKEDKILQTPGPEGWTEGTVLDRVWMVGLVGAVCLGGEVVVLVEETR